MRLAGALVEEGREAYDERNLFERLSPRGATCVRGQRIAVVQEEGRYGFGILLDHFGQNPRGIRCQRESSAIESLALLEGLLLRQRRQTHELLEGADHEQVTVDAAE